MLKVKMTDVWQGEQTSDLDLLGHVHTDGNEG